MDIKDLTKTLDSKDLPVSLGEKELDKPTLVDKAVKGDKLTFSFGVEGKALVEIFNDANDLDPKNPDDILGGAEAPVPLDVQKAWLKYTASVGIKTESGVSVDKLGFKFSGKRSVTSSVYRIHKRTEKLKDALVADLTGDFKSVFSGKQIQSLSVGEAVTYRMDGSLSAGVTVTWSDVFASNIGLFNEFVKTQDLVKIKVGAEASVSFQVTVEDSFNLKIFRKTPKLLGIHVAKAKSSALTAGLSVTVGAEIENKDEVKAILGTLVEGVFDESEKRIEALITKAEDKLSAADKQTLEKIRERLGWLQDENPLKKLQKEYARFKDKIVDKVKDLAEKKIAAGFKYDYQRLKTTTVLLEADMTDDGIDQFHTDLLKMNVQPVLQSVLKKEKFFSNAKFLRKEIKEKTHATGLSIGFGNWKASSDTKSTIEEVKQLNEQGQVSIAFEAKRSYSEKAGSDGIAWKIDMDAATPVFSTNAIPFANEFDYGFYLALEWTEKKLELEEVERLTDVAAIWGILDEQKVEAEALSIFNSLEEATSAVLTCELTVKPQAFEPVLPALAQAAGDMDTLAFALGKSMPRWGAYRVRRNIAERAEYYGQLWRSFLEEGNNPHPNTQLYADEAYRLLRTVDPKLADAEQNYRSGLFKPASYGSILNNNTGTYFRSQRLQKGFDQLAKGNDARATVKYTKVVADAFDAIEDFWRRPHHVKTLGTLLAMVLKGYPALQQYVEATATIQYTDKKGKEKVLVVAKTSGQP